MNTSKSVLFILSIICFICSPISTLHAQISQNFEAFVFVSMVSDTFADGYEVKDKAWVVRDEKGVAVAIYGIPKRREFVELMTKFAGKPATNLNLQSIRYELTRLYYKNDRVLPYIYVPKQAMRNGVVQFVIEKPVVNSTLPVVHRTAANPVGFPYIPPAAGGRTTTFTRGDAASYMQKQNTSAAPGGAPSVEPKSHYRPKLPSLK